MPVPLRCGRLPQPDFSATSSQHAAHARGVRPEARRRHGRRAVPAGAGMGSRCQQFEAELERVLPGRVRQLVDERLDDERERVAARRAQRAGRHAERHARSVSSAKFGMKRAGNSVGAHAPRR